MGLHLTKMKNENEIDQAFDNFHNAAAKAIADIEAFIQMDINAPQPPREAIFLGYRAKLVELKSEVTAAQIRANTALENAEHFRDMMPTSEEDFDLMTEAERELAFGPAPHHEDYLSACGDHPHGD